MMKKRGNCTGWELTDWVNGSLTEWLTDLECCKADVENILQAWGWMMPDIYTVHEKEEVIEDAMVGK